VRRENGDGFEGIGMHSKTQQLFVSEMKIPSTLLTTIPNFLLSSASRLNQKTIRRKMIC